MRTLRFPPHALRLVAVLGLAAGGLLATAASAGAEPGFGSTQAMPVPVGSSKPPDAPYSAISCPTTTSCTAVGPFGEIGEEGKPTVITQSSGVWGTPAAIPLPMGGKAGTDQPAQLDGVSCVDPTDCTAVGSYPFGTKSAGPLVVTETAGTWGAASSITLPSNAFASAEDARLTSVWCASAGNCVAIGTYVGSDEEVHSMEAQQLGGTWQQATELPDPSGLGTVLKGDVVESQGLACTDLEDCTYVALQVSNLFDWQPFAQTETAGTWAAPVPVGIAGNSISDLSSIACPTSTSCVAVGFTSKSIFTGVQQPMIATMTAADTWGTPVVVGSPDLSPATTGGGFTSVSCAGTTLCEAVGGLQGAVGQIPVADSDVNGTWDSLGLTLHVPAGTGTGDDSDYTSVSCPSTSACTAIGGAGVAAYTSPNEPVYSFSSVITPTEPVTTPSAPGAVVVVPAPGAALVSWQAPTSDGGSPVTGYTATAYPGGRTCTTTGARRCRITGLTNDRPYRFRVTDTTGFGPSLFSVPSTPVVIGAVPSAPRVAKVVTGHLNVTVLWHASRSSTGERIVSYSLTMTGAGVPTRHCVTSGLTCRIDGLVAKHTYTIVLTARDASGTSSPSAKVTFHSHT